MLFSLMKSSLHFSEASNRRARPPHASLGALALAYLVILIVVLLAASFIGSTWLPPLAVFQGASEDSAVSDPFLFWFEFRFRRLVYAGAVGAVLALAGTVFQAVLRNPLAEPYILGVSGAASLGAVAVRALLPAAAGLGTYGLLGLLGPLIGAVAGVVMLLGVARFAGLYDPPSLILCGAVLNAIFGALILLFYTLAPDRQVKSVLLWLMGNISVSDVIVGPHLRNTLLAVLVGCVLFMLVARHLDVICLGDEEAADLGVSPRRFRLAMLVAASLLTGVVVSATGPIGFIGLVVPHIMRRLHGPGHRRLVPLSMLGGAIFLMLADTTARVVVDAHLLPIGVITALVGGPFFLFLLVVRRRGEAVA